MYMFFKLIAFSLFYFFLISFRACRIKPGQNMKSFYDSSGTLAALAAHTSSCSQRSRGYTGRYEVN